MSDALRRAARTFVQTLTGTIIASGILSATAETGVVDWSALKKVGVSAFAAGIVAVLTFAQNFLEDNTMAPAFLKAPPSSGENPVPAPEGGHADGQLIILAVIAALVAVIAWNVVR